MYNFSAAGYSEEYGRPFSGQCCHLGAEDADVDGDRDLAPALQHHPQAGQLQQVQPQDCWRGEDGWEPNVLVVL